MRTIYRRIERLEQSAGRSDDHESMVVLFAEHEKFTTQYASARDTGRHIIVVRFDEPSHHEHP